MADKLVPPPPGFDELSKDEQIEYVEALWDYILDSDGEMPVPEWHLKLAEESLVEHLADPTTARPLEEVLDRLARRSE